MGRRPELCNPTNFFKQTLCRFLVKCLDGYSYDVRSVVCLVVIRISHMSQLVMEVVLLELNVMV